MIRRNVLVSAVRAAPAPPAFPALAQSGRPARPPLTIKALAVMTAQRTPTMARQGADAAPMDSPALRTFMAADALRWKKVADFARIQLD